MNRRDFEMPKASNEKKFAAIPVHIFYDYRVLEKEAIEVEHERRVVNKLSRWVRSSRANT